MDLDRLMGEQAGVVARRQVLAAGRSDDFVETRIRRREWARIHRGVYVDHTGVPVWGTVPERVAIAAGPSEWLSIDGVDAYRDIWRRALRAIRSS